MINKIAPGIRYKAHLAYFLAVENHARDTLYNGVYVVYMANIQYVYTAAHHLMPACVYCVYRYHIQYLLYINVLFLYTMLYMWCITGVYCGVFYVYTRQWEDL